MNREIKFRAWDGEQMHYTQNEFRTTQSMITAGQILSRYETVMQFTGLKDKNGKEIYEGDITDNGRQIVFEDGAFFSKKGEYRRHELRHIHSTVEIIGNIHESPELLTN